MNCHNPWTVEDAVFYLSSGCRAACQQPHFRSRIENNVAPAIVSVVLLIIGSEKQPFFETSFSFL